MTQHVFEAAGLGVAPFRLVAVEERRGPWPMLDAHGHPTGVTIGSPGQPMGTCDYCGTSIAMCCIIKSADGRRFIVGNECVRRTGDAGLKALGDRLVGELRKAAETKRIEAVRKRLFEDGTLQEYLSSLPSPNEFRAKAYRDTALDWAGWMMEHAGHSGQMQVVRMIDKQQKASQ